MMNFKSYSTLLALSLVAVLSACGEGKKEEKATEEPTVTDSHEQTTDSPSSDEAPTESTIAPEVTPSEPIAPAESPDSEAAPVNEEESKEEEKN